MIEFTLRQTIEEQYYLLILIDLEPSSSKCFVTERILQTRIHFK